MERVRLRTARVSDAAALLAIYAPYVRETTITFEYDVPDEREFAARIRHVLEKFPYRKGSKPRPSGDRFIPHV